MLQCGAAGIGWAAAAHGTAVIEFRDRAAGGDFEQLEGGAGFWPGFPKTGINAVDTGNGGGEFRYRWVGAAGGEAHLTGAVGGGAIAVAAAGVGQERHASPVAVGLTSGIHRDQLAIAADLAGAGAVLVE